MITCTCDQCKSEFQAHGNTRSCAACKTARGTRQCSECQVAIGLGGKTGLCVPCAGAKRYSDAGWIVDSTGRRKRPSVCHPDRPSVSRGACAECYHLATWADKSAAAAERKRKYRILVAESRGRAFKPRPPKGTMSGRCKACLEPMPLNGRSYCSPLCRGPSSKSRETRACTHCGTPVSGARKTCSDACAAARAPTTRSESRRARRRRDKSVKYVRSDKAEVIARLNIAQGGKCAICADGGDLVLDHCHASGEARALLCRRCNAAFGQMLESPERIQGLLTYALRWCDEKDQHVR
jgi:hypothetical protein